jgi:hypothetical protein
MRRSLLVIASALLVPAGATIAPSGALAQLAPPPGQSPAQSSALLPPVGIVRGLYLDATPTVLPPDAPGKHMALVVDVAPKRGMHVYAPGNRDYVPVALSVDGLPGVRLGPVQFPKAETFLFAPLKERVQVYSQPFRLTRTVTLDSAKRTVTPGATSLSLTGRLEYQACDDRVCYLQQTLPLTWTVPIAR